MSTVGFRAGQIQFQLFEEILVTDVDDSQKIAEAARAAWELIRGTLVPEAVQQDIIATYRELGSRTAGGNGDDSNGGEPFVAVRSSSTADKKQ